MKFLRLSRYYYLRFIRLKGDPQSLAWGTAIGVFIGITPTIPLHTVLILIVTMLTRSSAIAGIISSWLVCNPLTYLPIYYSSMVLGNHLTPFELSWRRVKALIDTLTSHQGFSESMGALSSLGLEAFVIMLVGGIVLALPFTLFSYILALRFFLKIQNGKRNRINS